MTEQVEELGRDRLGRMSVRVGEYIYCIEEKMLFEDWLRIRRGMAISELLKLHPKDRKRVFLKWKWGFEDDGANNGLELGRRNTMSLIEGRYEDDWYWDNMRKFEKRCFEIKKQIGLIKDKQAIDYIVEDAQKKDWI